MLNEGEVICDQCNGIGYLSPRKDDLNKTTCYKCLGAGKVDWVANAMGRKKPRILTASFSQTSMSDLKIDLRDELVEEMARKMAKKIDEEILECLNKPDSIKRYIRRVKY